MPTDLQIATEKLYKVFAQYRLRANIGGCPCCVSDADKARLYSKPLRQLTDDELSRYTRKALTTWGDLDDFKHFLPRILELLAQNSLGVEEFIILDKLDYSHWSSWPKQEVVSIREFLMTWWRYAITTDRNFDDLFLSLGQLIGSFQPILAIWEAQLEGIGFHHLINFLNSHTSSLVGRKWPYKGINDRLLYELEVWLISHLDRIEQAFYECEKTDPVWAEAIAIAYDNLALIRDSRSQLE